MSEYDIKRKNMKYESSEIMGSCGEWNRMRGPGKHSEYLTLTPDLSLESFE